MSRYESGVSFWDVRELAEQIGRLHHCIVHFEMHLPMRRALNHSWQVRAVARWYDERGNACKERGEGAVWPNGDATTFSGLELLLLARLERKIEDEVRDQARLAASQGRLF
jgi:hypothetical protein